jgi:DNA polymerase III subunit gamma/tau
MESTSLAVKYRPKTLNGLIGQDHIISAVTGMLKTKKMPSAIMLYGPTGLGKTTTARIIVRYLNCANPNPETYAPCGECQSCKMKEHPDVMELNAADSRGIDDVRNLINLAKNMPTFGKKRFMIIDEAQQLPTLSQQALLKPIEEPPKDTIWIICTMTPEKMLPAIAKRCTRLQVKPVEAQVLVKRLWQIGKREGVDFKTIENGTKVLKTIADFSNGGVRDAISALEPIIYAVQSGENVDPNTVLSNFLASPEAELDKQAVNVLIAVFKNDLKLLLEQTQVSDNIRGILNKLRWLIDYLLSNSIGKAKFIPYSGRLFAKESKAYSIKVTLATLISLQSLLVDIEVRLNSFSLEERVVFTAMVGELINNRASK